MNPLIQQARNLKSAERHLGQVAVDGDTIRYTNPEGTEFRIETGYVNTGGEPRVYTQVAEGLGPSHETHTLGGGRVCLARSLRGWDLERIFFYCRFWGKGFKLYMETGIFPPNPRATQAALNSEGRAPAERLCPRAVTVAESLLGPCCSGWIKGAGLEQVNEGLEIGLSVRDAVLGAVFSGMDRHVDMGSPAETVMGSLNCASEFWPYIERKLNSTCAVGEQGGASEKAIRVAMILVQRERPRTTLFYTEGDFMVRLSGYVSNAEGYPSVTLRHLALLGPVPRAPHPRAGGAPEQR